MLCWRAERTASSCFSFSVDAQRRIRASSFLTDWKCGLGVSAWPNSEASSRSGRATTKRPPWESQESACSSMRASRALSMRTRLSRASMTSSRLVWSTRSSYSIQQWPLSRASRTQNSRPARIRGTWSLGVPSLRAILSTFLKPNPRISRMRMYGSSFRISRQLPPSLSTRVVT